LKSAGVLALLAIFALVIPAAAAAEPPTVSIDQPGAASITTVPVSGHVDAHGLGTIWTFEVSTDGVNWTPTNVNNYTEANGSEPVSGVIEGLTAGTEYEVRLGAFSFEESVNYYSGLTPSFKTDPAPNVPALTLDPASGVAYTGSHLSGSVNPEGGNVDANAGLLPISWELQYALVSEPESWQPASATSENPLTGSNAEGTSPITVEAEASGLRPGTEYLYRLVAHYAGLTVATPEAGYGHFTTTAAAEPIVSGLTATETAFAGFVNPNAPGPAPNDPVFNTHWEFTCNPSCSFSGPSSGDLGADEPATEVTATPSDLLPGQTYDVTLRATNAGGEDSKTLVAVFTTPSKKPDISRETLWEPTETSIQLNSLVNAHNSALTDCHFEYGANGALDQTAPCENQFAYEAYVPPAGEGDVNVSARISDLPPGTEYSFRLVATNAAGTTEGNVRSFTSLEPAPSESCPNEAIRSQQSATALPDCRAYEKVSPEEKGDEDIVGDGETTVASTSGDAVAYSSRAQFAGAVGSGVSGQTQYLARRGAGGWSTTAITPMPRPDAAQTFFAATKLQVFSTDLSRAVVWGYDLPQASPGASPQRNNVYLEDTATRQLQPLTVSQTGQQLQWFEFTGAEQIWGLSDDARHIAFVSGTHLLPEAVGGPFTPNLYQWDNGVLSLAGVLPDGTVPPKGAAVFPNTYPPVPDYPDAMSADGSRLAFTSPPSGSSAQLYQRIDGNRTVWISEPETSAWKNGTDTSLPQGVFLQGMTDDGHTVFFITSSALLDSDTNGGPDVYRYTDSADPQNDNNLTMISHAGDAPYDTNGGSVIGFTEDGQRVYYQTPALKIMLWDHGTTRTVASGFSKPSGLPEQLTAIASTPGLGRTSSDGKFLAFLALDTPDFVHGPIGNVTNGHLELYLYSLKNDTLRCVSCPAGAAASDAAVKPAVTSGNPQLGYPGLRPHFLSNDGQLFFSTAEALVPEDVNGVADTYEYDSATGQLSLLSTGKGSASAMFADASPSGNDVFLVTRQQLVGADHDGHVDMYDARSGGGLPEPEGEAARECNGEACQPGSPAAPANPSLSSSATSAGNVHPRHLRCRKHQRKVRRKGKVTCVHKHRGKHERHLNHDRRASR